MMQTTQMLNQFVGRVDDILEAMGAPNLCSTYSTAALPPHIALLVSRFQHTIMYCYYLCRAEERKKNTQSSTGLANL